MGFSDRWLNQNVEPKNTFAIFAIHTVKPPYCEYCEWIS
jgi:hypothetical protein